jgi:hypothetical protein
MSRFFTESVVEEAALGRRPMSGFTESVIEQAALAWLEALGYAVSRGPTRLNALGFALPVTPNPVLFFR